MNPPTGKILGGGLLGLAIGLALVALAVYFLLEQAEPQEVLGVFFPLAAAQPALAFGVMALVPLRWGDSTETSPRVIAACLLVIALVAVVITAAGVMTSTLPWGFFALAPLAITGTLLVAARRFSAMRDTSPAS